MGFFNNIFGGGVQKREQQATEQAAQATPKDVQGGSFRQNIVHARNPQMALTVAAVYRAIELRSKTIGFMPVQLRRRNTVGKNFEVWDTGVGRRVNYLLQVQPNPIMTATSLWEQVTIDRLQLGNGFVYIERDEFGVPSALWLAICGGYNMVNGTYNLTYLSEYGIVNRVEVPKRDVLHFPNTYRYQNGFWGIPTLQFAAETLSLIKTERAQALDNAAKGGRVKLLIGEEKGQQIGIGMYNKDQMQKYAHELQDAMYAGNDILSLRGLDKVHNISMTSQDMQSLEWANLSADDVARFWGTPRPLLMLDTNSHYNDYANATMEYNTRTIYPDKREMEMEIARKLLDFKDFGMYDIHICERPLLAMDPERQAKVDQLNLQTGVKTVNELRAEHDMPSVENGDIIYVSTNLAELGSPKLRESGGGRLAEESAQKEEK
jgi:HK97 family phage portal protein